MEFWNHQRVWSATRILNNLSHLSLRIIHRADKELIAEASCVRWGIGFLFPCLWIKRTRKEGWSGKEREREREGEGEGEREQAGTSGRSATWYLCVRDDLEQERLGRELRVLLLAVNNKICRTAALPAYLFKRVFRALWDNSSVLFDCTALNQWNKLKYEIFFLTLIYCTSSAVQLKEDKDRSDVSFRGVGNTWENSHSGAFVSKLAIKPRNDIISDLWL